HYGVTGIICCAHDYPQFRKEITALFEGESKIVFMEKPAFSSRSYVATSREAALTFMIAEAIRNGFRKIGMICASRIWSSEKILCEEFRAAMKKNKLTIKEDLIVEYPEEKLPEICDRCDWVMEKMILPLRPDFLYVDDALHAVSLQSRLQNAGIDLTIYGGNHDPLFSNVIPAIQSFDPQYDKIAEKLLNRILTPDSSAEPEIVEACYRKNHST
ncbi:MAG: LacI family transcriptional regulator, partial [Erysipelotrichia bacterium]|nr:LacI family transcriptional regulator [Erysipelotrichia bacterium]